MLRPGDTGPKRNARLTSYHHAIIIDRNDLTLASYSFFVLDVPSAEGRYFARRRESGMGRGTCVRGSQPRTRAAAGQPPRSTKAPCGSGRRRTRKRKDAAVARLEARTLTY